jgi:hypothetical protein
MATDRAREPAEGPANLEHRSEPESKPEIGPDGRIDLPAHSPDRLWNPDGTRRLFRGEDRERLEALPLIKIEAKSDAEPAAVDAGREDDTKKDENADTGRMWQTIEEETGELKSWSSYRAATKELGTVEGTEVHHIVEQSQGEPKRAQFDVSRINTTDNMTRIPKDVHTNISAFYSSKPPGFDLTVRNWLGGKDWDYQHDYGSRVIDNEMRRHDDSADD